MLDTQILKNNLEQFNENLKKRNITIDIDFLLDLDEKRRKAKFEAEQVRAEQNKLGKDIAKSDENEKEELLKKAAELSHNFKTLSEKADKDEKEFLDHWIKIPNIVDPSSPVGSTDRDNKELKKIGEVKDFKNVRNHLEIGEALGLINVEKAAEVSGSRFSYIFGDLVKIEFNLVSYVLDKLSSKGFLPTVPPVLVREKALYGTGFFPDDAEQVYEIQNDELYLVGT